MLYILPGGVFYLRLHNSIYIYMYMYTHTHNLALRMNEVYKRIVACIVTCIYSTHPV